jgi:hypothetical protein
MEAAALDTSGTVDTFDEEGDSFLPPPRVLDRMKIGAWACISFACMALGHSSRIFSDRNRRSAYPLVFLFNVFMHNHVFQVLVY